MPLYTGFGDSRELHQTKNAVVLLDKSVALRLDLKDVLRVKHDLDGLHLLAVVVAVTLFWLAEAHHIVTADLFAEVLLPESHDVLVLLWRYAK